MHIKYVVKVKDSIAMGIIGFPLYFKTSPFLGFMIQMIPITKYRGIIVKIVYIPRKNQRQKLITIDTSLFY